MARVSDSNRPFDISLNREQAGLILKGLRALLESDKKTIIYQALDRDIEAIITIWDRRIKNEKIVLEERRKLKQGAKASEVPQSGQKQITQPVTPPLGSKQH